MQVPRSYRQQNMSSYTAPIFVLHTIRLGWLAGNIHRMILLLTELTESQIIYREPACHLFLSSWHGLYMGTARINCVHQNITSSRVKLNYDQVKPSLTRGAWRFIPIGQSFNHFYFYAPNLWCSRKSARFCSRWALLLADVVCKR